MKLERTSLDLLAKALEKLESGFDLPTVATQWDTSRMEEVLTLTAERMQDNYPYFHPLFAGQMLKPPHPLAKAAYMLALWINPNNHALDGGKASSCMEKEVVTDLARMIGWTKHVGHLTGGGTMANLEALWVAGKMHPTQKIIASDQAHYTHERICQVLQIPFEKVPSTADGTIDLNDLEKKLRTGQVGTVVCTMGTTGLGAVDPLPEIISLQQKYPFRIHLDTAYGGYFKLIHNLRESTIEKYKGMDRADSVVIDPHKHGLQPYGCGCVLFKDPKVAGHYTHDSPYTYFTSDDLHLGEISLECSRAGASAVALWATHQMLPPVPHGEFASNLTQSRTAALDLYRRLSDSGYFFPIVRPETDIVVWAMKGAKTSEMNQKANQVFTQAEKNNLYLSLYKYPSYQLEAGDFVIDTDHLVCLRSCLMKPEHEQWMDELWKRLTQSVNETIHCG